MKKTLLAFAISLLAVVALTPGLQVFAQTPDMPEEKRALYAKYYEKNKGTPEDQKVAYQLAQELVNKFGKDDDVYIKAAKKYIVRYEAAMRQTEFDQAMEKKDYAAAFEVGKTILASEPENFVVLIKLASAGQQSTQAGNTSFNAAALGYAKQATQLLEANKVTDAAGMTVPDALGYAYFVQGFLQVQDAPQEAAVFFNKAVRTTGAYKEDPSSFYLLGNSILNGEYQTKSAEYRTLYGGKPASPEQKAMFDQVTAVGVRAMEHLARAVALSTKPEQAAFREKVLAQLTDVYKSFHEQSTDGLDTMIASILAKPLS